MWNFELNYTHVLLSSFAGMLFLVGLTIINHFLWYRLVFRSTDGGQSKAIVGFLVVKNLVIIFSLVLGLIWLGLDVVGFSLGCFIGLAGGLFWLARIRMA